MSTHVVVDAANVVGSRPDGWWRDRAGAAQRLADRLADALDAEVAGTGTPGTGAPGGGVSGGGVSGSGVSGSGPWGSGVTLHLVLEGVARRAEPVPHPRLRIVRAVDDGDSAIVAVVRELGGTGVLVVTADRALRERVHALGATTTGPATLLGALDAPGTAP